MNNKKIKKQFLALVISLLLIGGIIGGFAGAAIKGHSTNAAGTTELYGTRDGKTLTDDGVLVSKDNDFVPIDCALSEDLQEYTYYLCQAYYIDFDFAMALMFTESSFDSDVISSTNDYGLMQINACNFTELEDKLGISDIKEPCQNIRAGLYILRGLFEKYDDTAKVCMAYNLGEYGAAVLWDKGIYHTTYSNKVIITAAEYEAQQKGV